jgi:SAM-dependent methyltransferase/glycosyltransferase involved in cell wall biosynthesis
MKRQDPNEWRRRRWPDRKAVLPDPIPASTPQQPARPVQPPATAVPLVPPQRGLTSLVPLCCLGGAAQTAYSEALVDLLGFKLIPREDVPHYLQGGCRVLVHGGWDWSVANQYPGKLAVLWHSGWSGSDLMQESQSLSNVLGMLRAKKIDLLWLEQRDVPPEGTHELSPIWSPEALTKLAGEQRPPRDPGSVVVGLHGKSSATAKNVLAAVRGCVAAGAKVHVGRSSFKTIGPVLQEVLKDKPHVIHETMSREGTAKLLSSVDLLVHPSFTETWPVMTLEAVYAGTPVVVSDAVAWAARLPLWAQGLCIVRPATSTKQIEALVRHLLEHEDDRQRLLEAQRACLDELVPVMKEEAGKKLAELGFVKKEAAPHPAVEEEELIAAPESYKPQAHTTSRMKILYVCTQRPGYGGASTETYEAIKRLRDLGHDVHGLFLVERETDQCDPDEIGGIEAVLWSRRDVGDFVAGDFDIAIGKNYEAPWVLRKRTADIPTVYLTSGIDHVSKMGRAARDVLAESSFRFPPSGFDLRAFRAVKHVLVHSTIDMEFYTRWLPAELRDKIVGSVIPTPNIAMPKLLSPIQKRGEPVVCFSASNWTRVMKNRPLMEAVAGALGKQGIDVVVCGERGPSLPGVRSVGLLPHEAQVRLLQQATVVVIPSFYDPSPNLYVEAILSGCDVVVSRNVGNIDGHPQELIAKDMSPSAFLDAIGTALRRPREFTYSVASPEDATEMLADRLASLVPRPVSVRVEQEVEETPSTEPKAEPKVEPLASIVRCPQCGRTTCVHLSERDGVVLAVGDDGHADSFGEEWTRWSSTQIDSFGYQGGYQGERNSHESFHKKTGLDQEQLNGRVVLDAGCGAGRYAEIAAAHGGRVVAVDISRAIFRTAELLQNQMREHLAIKGNLEKLPLESASVDVVYSIGVLHHTPNPHAAVAEIMRVLRPGGLFAGWVYAKRDGYDHPARKALRKFTSDSANRDWVRKFSDLGPIFRDLINVSPGRWDAFLGTLGISLSTNDDESRLDLFDWLTPEYQWQYTWEEWREVLVLAGFDEIEQLPSPVSFRCRRPK